MVRLRVLVAIVSHGDVWLNKRNKKNKKTLEKIQKQSNSSGEVLSSFSSQARQDLA
jgi:uncharacterized protein YqeY